MSIGIVIGFGATWFAATTAHSALRRESADVVALGAALTVVFAASAAAIIML